MASPYTDFNEGVNAVKHQNWDGAILRMNAALAAPDLNPAFRAPAHFDRALAYWEKQQPDKALSDIAASLQADPQYFDSYELRLEIHVSLKQFDDALVDLSALIAAEPASIKYYAQRGSVYLEKKNYDAALSDFAAIESISPNDWMGYALHGEALQDRGDYAGALKDFDTAIDHAPKNADLLQSRAEVYHLLGKDRDARDDLKDAFDLSPSADISMQLGVLDWKMGDYKAALRALNGSKENDADKAEYRALWTYLAAARGGGDAKSALDILQPNADLKKWPGPLIDIYAGRATPDTALKAAANADKVTEQNQVCEANFYAGEFYVLNKEVQTATPMLAKAASDCPDGFIERDAAAVDLKRLAGGAP